MTDLLIEKINQAINNNYDLFLEYSYNIDYQNQKIKWNNHKYYIKNLKIDHIIREIKDFTTNNKKSFIKLTINNMSKNISWYFINTPWDIIELNKIPE